MPDKVKPKIDLSEEFNNAMQFKDLAYDIIPYGILRRMASGMAVGNERANNYFGFKLNVESSSNKELHHHVDCIVGPGSSKRIINYCINQFLPPVKKYYKQYAKSKDCSYIYRALGKQDTAIPKNCNECIANCLAQR